jgi:hypothetical protein
MLAGKQGEPKPGRNEKGLQGSDHCWDKRSCYCGVGQMGVQEFLITYAASSVPRSARAWGVFVVDGHQVVQAHGRQVSVKLAITAVLPEIMK